MAKKWAKTDNFHPGGKKGKLHEELGVPKDEKIPMSKLQKALHSKNTEVRNDAIRAKTMEGWNHSGAKKKPSRSLYRS
jgi:hypothetical protein